MVWSDQKLLSMITVEGLVSSNLPSAHEGLATKLSTVKWASLTRHLLRTIHFGLQNDIEVTELPKDNGRWLAYLVLECQGGFRSLSPHLVSRESPTRTSTLNLCKSNFLRQEVHSCVVAMRPHLPHLSSPAKFHSGCSRVVRHWMKCCRAPREMSWRLCPMAHRCYQEQLQTEHPTSEMKELAC